MNREDIIRMAREAGIVFDEQAHPFYERFAALVAAAEREGMMQLFTDPENQPTQHGTVTVEYMQREIAAEREACAKVCEGVGEGITRGKHLAAAIRARSKS